MTIDDFNKRGVFCVEEVPRQWKKIIGSTTAPIGYDWFFNGVSMINARKQNKVYIQVLAKRIGDYEMYEIKNKKVEKILYLNCRDEAAEENKKTIQMTLRKVKPFSKYSIEETIPIEKMEKLLELFNRKYGPKLTTISITYSSIDDVEVVYYHGTILDQDNKWLSNISGAGTYEVLAKSCIFAYTYLKETGKI